MRDHVLRDPVGEEFILRIFTEVEERQDRNRRRTGPGTLYRNGGGGAAGDGLEREGQVPGGLEPLIPVLLETVDDDAVEPGGNRRSARPRRGGCVLEDRRDRFRGAVAVEWPLPREHFVQHAVREDSVGEAVSFPLAMTGTCRASPKSRILTRPFRVTNRFSGLRSRCTIPRAWALEQLRHEEPDTLVFPYVMDGQNVGVGQGRDRPRLALKPRKRIGLAGELRRDRLDGHFAAEAGITGTIDVTHPSRAEESDDFVGTQFDAR